MAAAKTRRRRGKKQAADLSGWQWDASTPEQRAHRTWRMTERGETDPNTGKTINPNGVTGVEFLSHVEVYVAQGHLEPRHLDAAWEYERVAREMRGSPSQRSCLDNSPIGYDEPDIDPRDQKLWNAICRALGRFEQAELDRVVYAHGLSTRLPLLARALDKVADVLGC